MGLVFAWAREAKKMDRRRSGRFMAGLVEWNFPLLHLLGEERLEMANDLDMVIFADKIVLFKGYLFKSKSW